MDINIGIIPVKCTACGVESSTQTNMELVLQLQALVSQQCEWQDKIKFIKLAISGKQKLQNPRTA